MTDLGTSSWKKTLSSKHQDHILAQNVSELQPAGDWRLTRAFLGKCHCVLALFFFLYLQLLLPTIFRSSVYGDLVWTAFSCAEHAKVQRKEDWFVLSWGTWAEPEMIKERSKLPQSLFAPTRKAGWCSKLSLVVLLLLDQNHFQLLDWGTKPAQSPRSALQTCNCQHCTGTSAGLERGRRQDCCSCGVKHIYPHFSNRQ